MLTKKYPLNILIAVACFTASCEKTINIALPPVAPQLVINCNSSVLLPITMEVSRTASSKEQQTHPDLLVRNATVQLYVDDVFAETIAYDSLLGYQSNIVSQPGKKYALKVSAPSYAVVQSSVVVPGTVVINHVERTPFATKDKDGNYQDALVITFSDPPEAGDFYLIKLASAPDSMWQPGPVPDYGSFCVNSSDASIETSTTDLADINVCLESNGIFVRDVLFNGRQKELKLYVPSGSMEPHYNGLDSTNATIELVHVTEAYFRYEKSSRLAQNTNGDPFSEPVNVYTNITNGLGIFSIVNGSRSDVR
jgi:hypothetical protein